MARSLPGFGCSAAQGIASSGIGNVEVRAIRGLANQKLILERIPDPKGSLEAWETFALTINGYDEMGGFEACADLANAGTPTTHTELRCCLFFEQRRERWNGGFTTNEVLIRELLQAIRRKVANGELA